MADEPKINMGWEVLKGIEIIAKGLLSPFRNSWNSRSEIPNLFILAEVLASSGFIWGLAEFVWSDIWGKKPNYSEIFRNVGLFVAAFVGLGFGIWRAWTAYLQTQTAQKQAEIAEQGLFTERFSKATEQLGSNQLSVRFGGIYALWRLAEDSGEKDAKSVFDILCAFVRKPTPDPSLSDETAKLEDANAEESTQINLDFFKQEKTVCRPDIQTIIDLIGSSSCPQRAALPHYYTFDLHGADLREAKMNALDFQKTNFSDTQLDGAKFSFAKLDRADFTDANIKDTWFRSASIKQADFRFANLQETRFDSSNLKGANFRFASTENTVFREADLEGTTFLYATLKKADFSKSLLQGANFRKAQLTEVNFEQSDLGGADFTES